MNQPFGLGSNCSRQELVERIDGWLCGGSMRRLVSLFSQGWEPQFAPTDSFYDSLLGFVDDRWNSRGVITTERYETKYKEVPSYLNDEIHALVDDLGLVDPTLPSYGRYDAVVAPGSQLWAMVMRVGYMLELRRHGVRSDMYVGLGSRRVLYPAEMDVLRELSLAGTDEYTLMLSIIRRLFGDVATFNGCEFQQRRTSSAADMHVVFDDSVADSLISVVNTENVGDKRPTTGDTLRSWLGYVGNRSPVQRVLVITQPLYVYQQGAVAIDILCLEAGLDVEVVGASGAEYIAGFKPPVVPVPQILQEVNGSVKRLVNLRKRLILAKPLNSTYK